jgi:hypothetical protein
MKTLESINFSKLLNSIWFWPVILTGSAVATAAVFLADSHNVLRPWLALWFLLVCPGKAIVRIFEVNDALLEWVLSLALSVSLAGIIVTVQIYTRSWSPTVALFILVGVTLAGVAVQSTLNLKWISWPMSQASIPLGRESQE